MVDSIRKPSEWLKTLGVVGGMVEEVKVEVERGEHPATPVISTTGEIPWVLKNEG